MKHIEYLPKPVWDEIEKRLESYKDLPFNSRNRRMIEHMCEQVLSDYCTNNDFNNEGIFFETYETGPDTFKTIPFRENMQ